MRRYLLVVALAAVMLIASAGAAFAGEATGNGRGGPDGDGVTGAPSHANSICAFSGQNDGNPPPGRVQSFGQNVKNGLASPQADNPGDHCQGGSNPRNP
jgi:hypothetical protein